MRNAVLTARAKAALSTIAAAAIVFLSMTSGALEPVALPEADATVAFEVVRDGRGIPVTVRELEALGLYRVTTTSPWEVGELTFEGVLFSKAIDHVGLGDVNSVRIRALDGYTQVIPRQDWVDKPLFLATRQDGKQLTRRTQGPTRIIYPLPEYPAYNAALHDGRWVWLIDSVEPAE